MRMDEVRPRISKGKSARRAPIAIICIFQWVNCPASATGQVAAPTDLKKLEISRSSEELARVAGDLRALERARREFLQAQQSCNRKISAIEQRQSDIAKALSEISTSLDKLSTVEGTTSLTPNTGDLKQLLTATENLDSLLRIGVFERAIGISRRPSVFPSTEFGPEEADAESVVKRAVADARESVPEELPTPAIAAIAAAIENLTWSMSGEPVLKANIEGDLTIIRQAVSGISAETILGELRKRSEPWCKALGDVLEKLNSEVGERAKTKVDLESAVARLSDEIQSAADSSEARNKTLLTWATIGLIIVLPLLFLLMALFADPIKEKIIENRTLIELVSMAFLLLTIIMLGTANKLMPEAIGTLLGTIAGYIFGRHTFNGKDPETGNPKSQATNSGKNHEPKP